MSLIVIGEAPRCDDGYVEFTQAHADVPCAACTWRNRMAHGYFDINLDVVRRYRNGCRVAPAIARRASGCRR
jgi:uncharacterized protein with HEPN domain